MQFQFPAVNYLYLLACLMATVLGVASRRKVIDKGSLYWLGVICSFAVWTLGELLANIGTTLSWQLAFQRLVYLGAVGGVVFWLLFAIHYSGNQRWLTPLVLAVMLVVPVMTLVLVASLEWHGLIYETAMLVERDHYYVLDLDYGVAFWVQILLCSYLYTAAGSALMIRTALSQAPIYRIQSGLIVFAALGPLLASLLYVSGVDLIGGFDPTSIFFVLSAVLITVATRHYHFLTLAPIARDLVFRNVNIGVVVVNPQHLITDINPAFQNIMTADDLAPVGHPIAEVLERVFDCHRLVRESGQWHGRVIARADARKFDLSSMPIVGEQNESIGYILLLKDATQMQKAMDEISRLADTDTLTELPNRRAIIEWMDKRSMTEASKDLVVVADLDHFKELNDSYGHHCGDNVLRQVARLIADVLEEDDKVARWGGEEFCMVLTGKTPAQGWHLLETLRTRIDAHQFSCGDSTRHLSMTFGMVQREVGEAFEHSIRRADMLMYDGKRRGRNRVISDSAVFEDFQDRQKN